MLGEHARLGSVDPADATGPGRAWCSTSALSCRPKAPGIGVQIAGPLPS